MLTYRLIYLCVSVARGLGMTREVSAMTVEKVSEEELSHVEVIKCGRQTVIEEVITRMEETETEIIEEKPVGKKTMAAYT